MARTLAVTARVRRAVPRRSGSSGCGSSRPRPRATPATPGSSSPGCARRSATSTSRPRSSPGDAEAALLVQRRDRRPAGASACPGPTSSSTSAAARPSWCGAPTDVEAARSVDVGCVRMTERHLHTDPPTRRRGGGRAPRRRWPRSTRSRRPSTSPASAPSSASPARSRRSRRTRCGCRPTTRTPSTWRRVPVDVMREACESLLTMGHAERAALPLPAPGPGRRHRRRGAGLGAGARPGAGAVTGVPWS